VDQRHRVFGDAQVVQALAVREDDSARQQRQQVLEPRRQCLDSPQCGQPPDQLRRLRPAVVGQHVELDPAQVRGRLADAVVHLDGQAVGNLDIRPGNQYSARHPPIF
jgi:hypothetical protein